MAGSAAPVGEMLGGAARPRGQVAGPHAPGSGAGLVMPGLQVTKLLTGTVWNGLGAR